MYDPGSYPYLYNKLFSDSPVGGVSPSKPIESHEDVLRSVQEAETELRNRAQAEIQQIRSQAAQRIQQMRLQSRERIQQAQLAAQQEIAVARDRLMAEEQLLRDREVQATVALDQYAKQVDEYAAAVRAAAVKVMNPYLPWNFARGGVVRALPPPPKFMEASSWR